MKLKLLVFLFAFLPLIECQVFGQDTFSIVAVDSITGEVGSAGASCVDLFNTSFSDDSFLGVLFPGKGAINSQAYYLPANQNNATARMNAGDTPQEIINWLIANDVQGNPTIRQYGVVAMVNGSPQSAAHTGSNTDNYKGHITGPNYAIQGNILSGRPVLDSMEARFLRAEGDLACKLMSAMQGANTIGADARCSSNGTSSLFAFLKVAQPDDAFGNPSFEVSVRTRNGFGIEPIDSLQVKFDAIKNCSTSSLGSNNQTEADVYLYPNPFSDRLVIGQGDGTMSAWQIRITNLAGVTVYSDSFSGEASLDVKDWAKGIYFLSMIQDGKLVSRKMVKY